MDYNQLESNPEDQTPQHTKEEEAKQQQPPPPYPDQPMVVTQPQVYYPPGTIVVPHSALLPKEKQPNDYIVLTLVVAIGCGIFNVTSLFFSIPAIICSLMAFERRKNGEYGTARQLGYAALILSLLCVTWVMIGTIIAIGVLVDCFFVDLCNLNYHKYQDY